MHLGYFITIHKTSVVAMPASAVHDSHLLEALITCRVLLFLRSEHEQVIVRAPTLADDLATLLAIRDNMCMHYFNKSKSCMVMEQTSNMAVAEITIFNRAIFMFYPQIERLLIQI